MKKLLSVLACVCLVLALSLNARAQNLTTVSASNITDINGAKLASGQLCFLITDQQDNPISVSIGGGGQALRRGYCSSIAAGVATVFTVPNPASTQPAGIYYRVTVKDSSTGQEVLRYTQVSFAGATFNFDNYAPQNLGNAAPLSGNSVTGNLSVTGNVAATGTVNGSNIPAGQINTGAGTTNAIVKYTNGATGGTGNSDLTDDGNVLTVSDSFRVIANTGLPTATGGGGWIAGGFTTPSAIRHYCGDGTGWRCEFAKRTASTDTLEAWITDGGVINAAGGYQFNGGAPSGNVLRGNGTSFVASTLAAADLSNGTSGTGAVALVTSPSLITPSIGGSGATFSGSTSGNTIVKASATASGTLTLPAATDTLVGQSTTDTLSNKTLTAPKIGTTTISEAPHFIAAYGFQPGNIFAGVISFANNPKPITVESIAIQSLAFSSCSVNPTMRVRNGGSTVFGPTLTLTSGASEWQTSGNNINYATNDNLVIEVTSAGTCTTPPSNLEINVTARMQ